MGNTYKLLLKKSDGSSYESSIDKMYSVPEIINLHDKLYIMSYFKIEVSNMPKNGYLYSNEPVVEKIVMFGHGNFGNAKM
jgi:hypothetical protein|nr:hypothetical protein [uncultured Emticicia sp.]